LSPSTRFSLVIPAYNEAKYLPLLLDTVDRARSQHRAGPQAVEVIVADNASTDDTGRIAGERGCRVAHVEKRAIASARNGGAGVATGEILCFVDADMRLHPATFDRIDDVVRSGRVVAGATGVRPERWSLGFAATWALLIPFVVATGMDTGVVFCRRADFQAIGGYDETLLFAEDVDLLFRLRRLGRTRGQRLARMRGAKATASLRKFDEHGDWHYFGLIWRIVASRLGRGPGARELAERYWYRPNR
jgi:glycosyltransferase involved in cell wall biosynthesis